MREILFRGKGKYDGLWKYGSLERFMPDSLDLSNYFILSETAAPDAASVIPETVGQFTGLKDRNGNKIFEGDYIVCRQAIQGNFIDEHIEMGYVEMKHGAFGLHRKQGYYRPFKDWLEDYEYEIIGNIHDNPELISGGSNAD